MCTHKICPSILGPLGILARATGHLTGSNGRGRGSDGRTTSLRHAGQNVSLEHHCLDHGFEERKCHQLGLHSCREKLILEILAVNDQELPCEVSAGCVEFAHRGL
jgi:hypothetical protein